jgi:Na+/H+ antiporter nhaC
MRVCIRQVKDVDTLMRWRREVIGNVFGTAPSEALLEANLRYYMEHIPDGSHIALLAEVDGEAAGCGAICLTDELPSPDNPSGRCAYIMNIYVLKEFRGHGVGHAIVRRLVEIARELDCDKIYLETTDEARSLYSGIGFKELPGIMKYGDFHDIES